MLPATRHSGPSALLLLLLQYALSPQAVADPQTASPASFDCGKAATRVERVICSSADVSDLDAKLATAFQKLLRSAGTGESLVRDQQRKWLQKRNGCTSVECLKEQYAKRLREVNEFVQLAPNVHWEPMNVVNLSLANGQTYYADFMDRASLRQVGRLRSIWTLMNYTEPRSFRNKDDDFTEYRSLKVLEYFDCEAGKMADARNGYFSGEMGGGNEVHADVYSTSSESLRWEQFDVNGAISSKVRLVCGLAKPNAPNAGSTANGLVAGDELAQIEGYYPLGGTCFVRSKSGEQEPCGDPGAADSCLLIRRIDAHHAALNVESFQAEGRECGLSGIATLGSHELTYTQANDQTTDSGRKLVIRLEESNLRLHYPDEGDPAFCAANASLEGLTFKRADRLPVASHTCGE